KTADRSLVYRLDADHIGVERKDGKSDKVVYERGVESGHADPITTLAFTPQCQLVSAARDNTVRVWQLKENGVARHGEPIANRGGSVAQLGVRADGKWHLFDKGRDLQLVSLEQPGETITTLRNPGVGSPFETLAQFS